MILMQRYGENMKVANICILGYYIILLYKIRRIATFCILKKLYVRIFV